MNYRRLGTTGVYVSELCLGAMTLTGDELARLDEVSATPAPYPAWMLSLGDDRLPGTSRDLAAQLKKK